MGQGTSVVPSPELLAYEEKHITDNRVPTLIAADVTCFTLGFIAVVMRLASRRIAKIKFMHDDYLIIVALVFTASVFSLELVDIRWGIGKHTIVGTNPHDLRKTIIATEFLYAQAMQFIKLSIIYLYHRVFFVSRNFTRGLWAIGLFVFCYSGLLSLAATMQCFPLRRIWDSNAGGYCLDVALAGTILAAFNVLTDLIILVMPIPVLWKMQMEIKQKLQIMAMFLLGGFVLVCSVVRAIVIHEESWTNPNWDDLTMGIWTMAELGIGIVSACLPTMRPLFGIVMHRVRRRPSSDGSDPPPMMAETRENSDQDLGVGLHQAPSNPAHSKTFAHLGVLGDLEHGEVELGPGDRSSGEKEKEET